MERRYELVDDDGEGGNITSAGKTRRNNICSYKVSIFFNVVLLLCSLALGILLYFQMDFAEYPSESSSSATARAAPSVSAWVPLEAGQLSLQWESKNDSLFLWYGVAYTFFNSTLKPAKAAPLEIVPVFGNAYTFPSPLAAKANVLKVAVFGVDAEFKKTMGRPVYLERRRDHGKGACSDIDAGLMSHYRSQWVPVTGKCGASCIGVGSCTADCIQKAFKISQGCANCFGALTSCTVDKCALSHGEPCLKDTSSPACITCATKYCRSGVVSCTGLPENFVPQPEPVPTPKT